MPKISAGTLVKAALLAAFPFLVDCRAASVETKMVVRDDEVRVT